MAKSFSSCCIQTISVVVTAKIRYSASAVKGDMVGCFLDFQDIRESPKNMPNQVIDLLESRHEAQSTSENALIWIDDEEKKRRPLPNFDLR